MSLLTRVAPESLRGYKRNWLSTDLLAGVTLAAIAIPECMGHASIAQTPVVTGLYTIIFPTLLFAILAIFVSLYIWLGKVDLSGEGGR